MENVKHNLLVFLFGEQPDWTAMWTAVIALIAFVGVIVAPRQLVGVRATSRADYRGRDGHRWPPPAQIRTRPTKASGSYLGCLTSNRMSGQG
jgi:hypothetical protein